MHTCPPRCPVDALPPLSAPQPFPIAARRPGQPHAINTADPNGQPYTITLTPGEPQRLYEIDAARPDRGFTITRVAPPHRDPTTLGSLSQLVEWYALSPGQKERLRKRLEVWRRQNFGEWVETQDAGPRDPRYLYPIGKVRAIVDAVLRKA